MSFVKRAPALALVGAVTVGAVSMQYRTPLVAQDAAPTFAKDVAPILYENCTSCHRQGGLGPFSLMDYDSAKANVKDIRDAVKSGYMPPWHAEGPHDVFSNDRRLSEFDKSTILRWIDGGAKPGDLKKAPAKPTYATGWELGTPDAIVTMPSDFTVPAKGTVDYQYFEIPTNFTEDKWVTAIEFMPGAREVVHHLLVYAKVPQPQQTQVATAATATAAPAPGAAPAARPKPLFVNQPFYETPPDPPRQPGDKNPPPRQLGTLIGGTAPGTNTMYMPAGTAIRVRKGTVLTFQMHYTASGHEMHDRTSVGFRFATEAPTEEMRMSAFINGAFTLPAGKSSVAVESALEPTEPVVIHGLLPHTHLRGKKWKYELVLADGTRKIVLDVPRYDFNWQTYYFFKQPLEIPAGAKLVSTAWYDNSAENPSNPDAKINVKWGDQTWEEMQYTGFLYTVPSRKLKAGN
ncbi:cytochrome c [Gemmatimonas sp.]|uniref:c-type cytochrome n=1 Tax=Gemmatimonas sp. TaxID=1962908 RepID=UPI0033413597